jgi:hypothetical protein
MSALPTPAECLAQLAERGLLPADRLAVYVAGSLVRGWGNATSDLDVYVVTPQRWQPEPGCPYLPAAATADVPVAVFYVGDRRWDVEYWSEPDIERLLDTLSWEAFESGRTSSVKLPKDDIAFVQRLTRPLVVEGEDRIQRWEKQFTDSAIRTMVATYALYVLDHLTEDAVGMLGNDDPTSAVLAARQALGYAVDALLASHGEFSDQPKWRARRMAELTPAELPFDDYWNLETMRTYDPDAPQVWVSEVLRACQDIADEVQL